MTGPPTVEDELLVTAAHPTLSAESKQRLSRLLARQPDWWRLVDDAERHGIAASLHGHLCPQSAALVPPAVQEALAHSARACVAWNLRLRHELGRLLPAFDAAGIAVMPLKGPVLADQLYPDPLLRATGDLDLLVRHADCEAGAEVLQGLGYRRLPPEEQGAGYHTRFGSDDAEAPGVVVELHRELGESHASGPDVRAIWASASRSTWAGQAMWSMALPDLLLYLCFHAAKDGLASLRTLVDVTLLVTRHGSEISWEDVTARTRAAQLAAPVYLGLGQSRALLGAAVPDPVLAGLRPRGLSWRVSQSLFEWRGGVLHVPDEMLVGPVMAILMMLWEDSARGRLRHLRRNLLPATSLRGRWTGAGPAASWMRWYPIWLWQAARHATRQIRTRPRGL